MSEEENNTNESTESKHELERVRWEGKTTYPVGQTPFGFFDGDAQFTPFAPKASDWAACGVYRIK